MRIVFINKYDVKGGAAIAAFRIAEALQKYYGAEVYFITGIKNSNLDNIYSTRQSKTADFIEKCWNYGMCRIGLQYVWLPLSSSKIEKYVSKIKPDIISIHNIHGGYFETSLLIKLSKIAPIVWTMHDMWAFTANAAHTFGDESFMKGKVAAKEKKLFPQVGVEWGNFLLRRKRKIYKRSNIVFISPSRWLCELAEKSWILKGQDIRQIFNCVDGSVFKPSLQKDMLKDKYGIEKNRKVLTFSTESLGYTQYKGGEYLINALQLIDDMVKEEVTLLMIGNGRLDESVKYKKLKPIYTGYITDKNVMAEYMGLSDLYIYPTKADNLPNVLVEACATGLPAVTFDIGGCKEIIEDGKNGYVLEAGDVVNMAKRSVDLLNSKEQRELFRLNARKMYETHFSYKVVGKQYDDLFREIE